MKKSGTYQKRYFTPKDKRTTMRSVGVAESQYNQISYPQVNDPQEEQLYYRGSPAKKSYGPHVKFPSLGVHHQGNEPPEHVESQQGLTVEAPLGVREGRTFTLKEYTQNLTSTWTQGKSSN